MPSRSRGSARRRTTRRSSGCRPWTGSGSPSSAGGSASADSRLVPAARQDLGVIGADRRRGHSRLGLLTFGRLLDAAEPHRARWAMQHLPYPVVQLMREKTEPPLSPRALAGLGVVGPGVGLGAAPVRGEAVGAIARTRREHRPTARSPRQSTGPADRPTVDAGPLGPLPSLTRRAGPSGRADRPRRAAVRARRLLSRALRGPGRRGLGRPLRGASGGPRA